MLRARTPPGSGMGMVRAVDGGDSAPHEKRRRGEPRQREGGGRIVSGDTESET